MEILPPFKRLGIEGYIERYIWSLGRYPWISKEEGRTDRASPTKVSIADHADYGMNIGQP